MAIEGIDAVTSRRQRTAEKIRNNTQKRRNKAEDFPLFYRTKESMIIDEAICASLSTDGAVDAKDSCGNGKGLSEKEIDAIRTVVNAVDSIVQQLMLGAFRESYFTCGVINCLVITYVFVDAPQHFWLLYLCEMVYLLPCNLYHRINARPLNKALYYFDYCWVMNFVAVLSLIGVVMDSLVVNLIDPNITILSDAFRKHLFMAVLGTSCGPLLAATAALPYIALLFHDIDAMTSLFIHIFPPMVAFHLRWNSDLIRDAWPSVFHLNYLDEVHFLPSNGRQFGWIYHMPGTIAGNTLVLYLLWFVSYVWWMNRVGLDLPRSDMKIPGSNKLRSPKYDTCFHSFMRGGACIAIGETLWNRPRQVALQQIRTNHFERRDFFVHMLYHAITTSVTIFVLGYTCYFSKMVHGLALTAMVVIAVHRGAKRYSYYSTSMYCRTLKKHFSVLLRTSSDDEYEGSRCDSKDIKTS